MSNIKWQNPPSDQRTTTPWTEIAKALRERPNEWALVKEGTFASVATTIKFGTKTAFRPAGSFEARTSKAAEGKCDVYARYVGEVSA